MRIRCSFDRLFAGIFIVLLSTPVHAGPPNAVPTPPAPVTPSATQYPALTGAAVCGGQYTNTINDAANIGLVAQSAGVLAQGVALTAQGVALGLEIAAAAIVTVTQGLVPGLVAEGVALGANLVALGATGIGLETSILGTVIARGAAALPQCDSVFNGTVQISAGGSIITGNSHFNNSLGVVGDVNVGGKVQATRIVATDNTTTDTLTANGLSTTTGIANTGNIATTTLGIAGLGTTNGIANTGNIATTTLGVTGLSTTNGIANTGNIATTTLGVTGLSTTTGIANTGNVATTTLGVTGLSTTTGIANTGNVATTTLGVTGLSTTTGIANTGNVATTTLSTTAGAAIGGSLSVASALSVGGIFSASGPTASLSSGANSLVVNPAGVAMTGNGAQVTVNGANASMVNATNHGIVVSASQTSITGGTSTTSLLLNDSGATFADVGTGGPARVMGVADAVAPNDAVNFGQLQKLDKRISLGIASTTAMANIPPLDQNKTFAIGMGVGHFNSSTALALGGNYRMTPNAVLRASMGFNGRRSNTFGAGASFSW